MAVVEMQKIHILSLPQHQEAILKCLQTNEAIDLQVCAEGKRPLVPAEEVGKHELKLAEIKSALSFLESVTPKKKNFIETFLPSKEEISEKELGQTYRDFNYSEVVAKTEELETRLTNLKALKTELQQSLKKLLPWQNLDLPLNTLTSTGKICLALGRVKNKLFKTFKAKLDKISDAFQLDIVNQAKEDLYLIIAYLLAEKKIFDDLLPKIEFEQITLPVTERTASEEIAHNDQLLKNIKEEIREITTEARGLTQHLNKLKYVYDYILQKKSDLEIKLKLGETNYAFIIEGWIKSADMERIKKALAKVTKEVEIYKIEPAAGEKPPVALKNPRLLTPFELITKTYGLPKHEEFDPSLALSFFFVLFFGLCLGDFGYGTALAIVSIYFLKKYKLPEGGKNLFKLLLLGGLVSALVGAATGSYFGASPKEIPSAVGLKNFLISIQIVDPIQSPITMLIFSLALGVIQILFGIFLQMVYFIKNKQYLPAILDSGLWLYFLSSLVFLIISYALSPATVKPASYLSIIGAGLLVLTQGRHKKTILEKFWSGLLSLYKVSGYMGDTLSYSRLLALGMSSSIIGSVINILAGMVKGSVPVIGMVLMIVFLFFGHLFNLIISVLGAFVHSMRLQMVEFFGKFYEGGGREFRPYKRVAEYTVLTPSPR